MVVAKVVELDPSLQLAPRTTNIDQLREWAAEWYDPETEDDGFQGSLVELKGLTGIVLTPWLDESTGGDHVVNGELLNGRQGRAALCEDGTYMVETLEGDSVLVPKENLCKYSQMALTNSLTDSLSWTEGTFSFGLLTQVVESIQARGYSVIETPGAEKPQQAAASISKHMQSSAQPKADFAGALGLGLGEDFSWVDAVEDNDIFGPICDFCISIAPFASQEFGFVASPSPAFTLIRKLRQGADEDSSFEPVDDIQNYLDFVQRRRLCMIYLPKGSAEVELSPRESSTNEKVRISLDAESLFVFRHDRFRYSVHARKAPAVAVQGWIVKEHSKLQITEVLGDVDEVMEVIGAAGQTIRGAHEIHVLSAALICSGQVTNVSQKFPFLQMQTDGFIEMPMARWDHNLYYSPEYEGGLAVTKHAAFADTSYLCSFDHEFFDLTYEDAKSFMFTQYKYLELCYEALHAVGYTRDTLKGAHISHYSADGSRDSEQEFRYEGRILSGYTRWSMLAISPQIVSHVLGLTGPNLYIETACSASNAAMNCLYQDLVGTRDAKKHHLSDRQSTNCHTGICSGNNSLTSPIPFVGLSQGRMLGKMGRCQTFNASASGFARGEGCGCLVVRNSTEIRTSMEQLMAVIGGNVNQDGRSASLTAPNGPSQTAVIRGSHRSAGITSEDISVTELHGTGTALGDPIETGSMRTLVMSGKVLREAPLPNCAGKSNTGHPELVAGITAFIKTLYTFKHACTFSNCHLKELNQNIEEIGYPAFWATETVDVGLESFMSGCSSFGFGGTNARTEFWGRCAASTRSVSPFSMLPDGSGAIAYVQQDQGRSLNFDMVSTCSVECSACHRSMCLLCKDAIDDQDRNHICISVREDIDSYEVCSVCYKGSYVRGGFSTEE